MKRVLYFIVLVIITSCSGNKLKYPKTKKVDQVDSYFGTNVEDPYRWLEDNESEEVGKWVKAQNELTFNYLSNIPYREKIKKRLTELWNFEKMSIVKKAGSNLLYLKNNGLQNQDVLYIQKDGKEEILLDPNELSEDGTVALVDDMLAISPDNKYLTYGIAKSGSDWNEVFVLDIETGEKMIDHLDWIKFSSVSWGKDGFYYSRYKEPRMGNTYTKVNENHSVYFHKMGTPQAEDMLVYTNPDFPKLNYTTDIVGDGKYLIIYETESTSGNSFYIKNLNKKNDPLIKLTANYDYDYKVVGNIQDQILVLTNYKSPKYKLVSIDVNSMEVGRWRTIISETGDVLEGVKLLGDKILAKYISNAYSKLKLFSIKGEEEFEVELPGIGTVTDLEADKENNGFYYAYESFTTPKTIYKYSLEKRKAEIYFQPEISFEEKQYETKQVFYRSKDGTKIPMFLVHKKDLKRSGINPTLLYGYGGFNVSLKPKFKPENMILLENGGVYAIANLRGGGEKGEKWHLAGAGFNKQNVFDDFISAAEYLIHEKYTDSNHLAIHGASNGGLLVGTVVNQAPQIFSVALPAVGVMDMLRYHKFTVGWMWTEEYGSSEDSAEFTNIYKYSPLHNIKRDIEYPATMVLTADHDDRVVPAHSFKYIATLQEKYNGDNPVIIRVQTGAGHGSGKPTSMKIQEEADKWSFIFFNMNSTPKY